MPGEARDERVRRRERIVLVSVGWPPGEPAVQNSHVLAVRERRWR